MTHKELMRLHELRGRLDARVTILDSSIKFAQGLSGGIAPTKHNAYFQGKVDVYREWLQSVMHLLAEVNQLIKEVENVEEED